MFENKHLFPRGCDFCSRIRRLRIIARNSSNSRIIIFVRFLFNSRHGYRRKAFQAVRPNVLTVRHTARHDRDQNGILHATTSTDVCTLVHRFVCARSELHTPVYLRALRYIDTWNNIRPK